MESAALCGILSIRSSRIFALSSPRVAWSKLSHSCVDSGLREMQGPLQPPGCPVGCVGRGGTDLGMLWPWPFQDGSACWVPEPLKGTYLRGGGGGG